MESWSKFRRGLRPEDQDALDELFRAARLQLAGSAYAARPIPFESIAMSMLVSQQRAIQELREKVMRLEKVETVPSTFVDGSEYSLPRPSGRG